MKVFNDFVSNTSMHGWSFFGSPNGSRTQKLFWLIVLISVIVFGGYLLSNSIMIYMASYTIINVKDRTSSLDDIHFPSLVICNINPLRKSFIYWLHQEYHEELRKKGQTEDVSITDLFDVIGNLYFSADDDKGHYDDTTEKYSQILDKILDSEFFENRFKEFMNEKLNGSNFDISPPGNKLYIYHQLPDAPEMLGDYNEDTKKTYHKNFLRELASQWRQGQMIPYIKWDGMDPDDIRNETGGVFLEIGYPTSFGLCNFITPYFRNMPPDSDQMNLRDLHKGALNGENNGLSVLVDAETFDYGNGFADVGERAGVGFKVAVVHHLDSAVIESNGMQVNVGEGGPRKESKLILNNPISRLLDPIVRDHHTY